MAAPRMAPAMAPTAVPVPGVGGLHDHAIARRKTGTAWVVSRLLHGPDVTVVSVTLKLVRRLATGRIHHDRRRNRLCLDHDSPRRRGNTSRQQGRQRQKGPGTQIK